MKDYKKYKPSKENLFLFEVTEVMEGKDEDGHVFYKNRKRRIEGSERMGEDLVKRYGLNKAPVGAIGTGVKNLGRIYETKSGTRDVIGALEWQALKDEEIQRLKAEKPKRKTRKKEEPKIEESKEEK